MSDPRYDLELVRQQLLPHEVRSLSEWKDWEEDELCRQVRDCDVVVTGRQSPRLPDVLCDDRGKLRLLAHCHGTVKHLVSKELVAAGLRVCNWGDQVAGVAESALSMLLTCLKQLPGLDQYIRHGWQNDQRIYMDFAATLNGRDVGLYGFGPIGQHMARMLAPFGTQIAIYDPYATDVPPHIRVCSSLRELFASCQCISIHCGLNDATRDSVTGEMLQLLPQGGIVVNTARGAIVVEEDLAAMLAQGRLLAAVDVIRDERAWSDSPLATQPSTRCLLTGHIVGKGKGPPPGSPQPAVGLPQHSVDNIHALAQGAALNHEIDAQLYDLKT